MSWNTLLYEKRGHAACITLNRPDKLNAVSIEMMKELGALYREVEEDDDVWTLIITGAGRKALCTGADLSVFELTKKNGHTTGIDMWGEPMLANASFTASREVAPASTTITIWPI